MEHRGLGWTLAASEQYRYATQAPDPAKLNVNGGAIALGHPVAHASLGFALPDGLRSPAARCAKLALRGRFAALRTLAARNVKKN